MSLDAGLLNHRITFQSTAPTSDNMGGFTTVWADVATVWAAVWPTSGKERLQDMKLQAEVTHKIRIRYWPSLLPEMRIKFKDRYFRINSIINPDEAGEMLDLLCLEVAE